MATPEFLAGRQKRLPHRGNPCQQTVTSHSAGEATTMWPPVNNARRGITPFAPLGPQAPILRIAPRILP